MTKARLTSLLLIILGSFLFAGAGKAHAATYYTDNTCSNNGDGTASSCAASSGATGAFNSIANMTAKSGGYSPGDIIDGTNKVFYAEKLIFPSSGTSGNPITIQNFTLDGRASWNSDWGLAWQNGGTYEEHSWNIWSLYSGEIYKKNAYESVHRLWEDGVELTPVVSTSMTDVDNLQRGQFTNYGGITYYRASDGANVSMHNIQAPRPWDTGASIKNGMLMLSGLSYVNLENIILKNFSPQAYIQGPLFLDNSNHITITNVTCDSNYTGPHFTSIKNVSASNLLVTNSILSGVMIEGNTSNLNIQGKFTNNGRAKYYDGVSSYAYGKGDMDGIGIGGSGGTMSNITIHDSDVINNGAPDSATTILGGAGIYLGTSYSMTVSNLNILRSIIAGNHLGGIIASNQFLSGNISYNKIYNNALGIASDPVNGQIYDALHLNIQNSSFVGVTVANNVFAYGGGTAGLHFDNNNAGVNTAIVENNLFYNNGTASNFSGDIWIQYSNNNVIENNNLFYRLGTRYDSSTVIQKYGNKFDINHIVGSSAGYWQFTSGQGVNDIVGDAKFVNPASYDFHLQPTSPAINAGVDVGLTTDFAGNSIIGLPNIGAYEYQGTVSAPPPDTVPPTAPTGLSVM